MFNEIIDRYTARPGQLQEMCLAEFAVTYAQKRTFTQSIDSENENTEQTDHSILSSNIKQISLHKLLNNLKNLVLQFMPLILPQPVLHHSSRYSQDYGLNISTATTFETLIPNREKRFKLFLSCVNKKYNPIKIVFNQISFFCSFLGELEQENHT
ncbi:hypothetical protein MAR_017193 [Mya arenaria]|uniref:Uncharacterized protein n=1 Tax=Mya arenaria TaxID=6604 RepID=A0ABY7EB23_MYAAR|nr:hypothetical protein MAR_017193 [Mya arenaria]